MGSKKLETSLVDNFGMDEKLNGVIDECETRTLNVIYEQIGPTLVGKPMKRIQEEFNHLRKRFESVLKENPVHTLISQQEAQSATTGLGPKLTRAIQDYLKKDGPLTYGDLADLYKRGQLETIPGFGPNRIERIKNALMKLGLLENFLSGGKRIPRLGDHIDPDIASDPDDIKRIRKYLGKKRRPTYRDLICLYLDGELENIPEVCYAADIMQEQLLTRGLIGLEDCYIKKDQLNFSGFHPNIYKKIQEFFGKDKITVNELLKLYENGGLSLLGFTSKEIKEIGRRLDSLRRSACRR